MLFAHDTEEALRSAAALINTAPWRPGASDELATPEQLDAFVEAWRWSGSRTHDEEELRQVQELRPRLRRIWTAPVDEMVEGVNALLRDAGALPQLVRHDGWDWHLHAVDPSRPLAERMAVEAAMALVDVIRAGETHRLKTCGADDCEDVVVDLSKNRSKRYCDSGCGNRLAAAAYRARRAQES
ncbi:MAG TPA: CGNR zinc finger domain-containing protein [Ornithinicoccus sp.]|nr:CGNR zinc finger domain-containing protein [Ornithinicoccus sp.]